MFVFHGSQKLFGWFGGHGIEGTAQWMASIGIPFPTLSVLLAGSTELVGGLAGAFDVGDGGMEFALTLGVVLVALGLIGPGRVGLPALVARLRGAARAPRAPEPVAAH